MMELVNLTAQLYRSSMLVMVVWFLANRAILGEYVPIVGHMMQWAVGEEYTIWYKMVYHLGITT